MSEFSEGHAVIEVKLEHIALRIEEILTRLTKFEDRFDRETTNLEERLRTLEHRVTRLESRPKSDRMKMVGMGAGSGALLTVVIELAKGLIGG